MFNTPYENMTVNSYLVWDQRSRLAAVFDTGATCEPMLGIISTKQLTVRYLFLTHTHEDHVADAARLVAVTGADLYSSELEPFAGGKTFRENQTFHLDGVAIETDLAADEPKALIGFAGPRVIQNTMRQSLPPGFQRSEFLQSHGFVDMIVPRKELKPRLIEYLSYMTNGQK